jgi:ADP-ribose pyrophosphatase
MKLNEKTISSRLIYECFFMKLYEDEVELPNNKKSQRIYIHHDGAAAVLPITQDGNILLIKQFRYPIKSATIEIPAGKKDDVLEDGLTCAKRELEEETGYTSNDIKKITDIHNCLGYSDEKIELFLATSCEKMMTAPNMDEDEFIELLSISKVEAKELLFSGKITDAKTIIALQYYLFGVTQ